MTTTTLPDLGGLPVFLSAALPDSLRGTPRALWLQNFVAAFVRGLLAAGGRLIFGGHPSVTPLVQPVRPLVSSPKWSTTAASPTASARPSAARSIILLTSISLRRWC